MEMLHLRRRHPLRLIISFIGVLVAFCASLLVIEANVSPASAYCYGNGSCYRVEVVDDAGSYDPYIWFKCPNPAAAQYGITDADETYPYRYSTDGYFDTTLGQWNANQWPCSFTQGYGVTGIQLDAFNSGIGKIMCKSDSSGIWPGTSWVEVGHRDGSWRYFPGTFYFSHVSCKAVLQ